jgi:hypothetical protein
LQSVKNHQGTSSGLGALGKEWVRGRADGDAKSREICQDLGGYVTMHLFEDLLKDEEGHINFLETQLRLLASIGDEGYGLLNAAPRTMPSSIGKACAAAEDCATASWTGHPITPEPHSPAILRSPA